MNKELYDKFLTDSLNESEEKELLEVLSDEEKANEFTEYIIETNMMVSSAENIEALKKQNTKSRTENRLILMIAAAMIILGLLLYFQPQKFAYTVAASTSNQFSKGQTLNEETIQIEQGQLSLISSSGNEIVIKAPAQFEISSENEMRIEKGLMKFTLSPNTENFTVHTPHGLVKDLGTSFGLVVKQSSSDVHLYDGKVYVESALKKETLSVGEAVTLQQDGSIHSIQFTENFDKLKGSEVYFLGERQIRPGELMELQLDRAGQSISAQLKLDFEEEKDFKYKVIAYSKGKQIFESNEFNAADKPRIDIPAANVKELKIEMKVTKGFVTKGLLEFNKISLKTEGYRPYEGDVLVESGSYWQYLFESKPAEGWKLDNFDAAAWKSGKASIGYGDADLITKIGSNDLKKTVSRIYFRHEFSIEDLEINSLKKLNVSLLADDGAVIYLNGKEIIRYNLPEGEINDNTKALKTAVKATGEMIYNNFTIPPTILKMGKNVISTVLIQRKGKSSDMRFDLKMSAF